MLTKRWTRLKHHNKQRQLWLSEARFIVNPAGRRSGKTEIAKRKTIREALRCKLSDGRFLFSAPTREQAKRIYWQDLKNLVPDFAVKSVNETELTVRLHTGVSIGVIGMDKPMRAEGDPLDWIVLDEYGNMKESVWEAHVRPALSTIGRPGRAMFIGVPEGRNHYWRLRNNAIDREDWEVYTWKSAEILDPKEVEDARRDMDPLLFAQEYEADFISYSGVAYYPFNREIHSDPSARYDANLPLVFCFDFNVEPGVAVILQEQYGLTTVIGEVYIPKNSNTVAVCNRLKRDWGHHKGELKLYGDASGGARGTAQTEGSDWDLIRQAFPHADVYYHKANPAERARINAVNTRLLTADGKTHLRIGNAPNLIEDFEGVLLLEGGSGEIDKKKTPKLTHLTDAIGYYIEYEFPLSENHVRSILYV